ncbi:MAG: hypothetical protein GY944_21170 [bacterium]|nr:hypothetical protein [bacterium]
MKRVWIQGPVAIAIVLAVATQARAQEVHGVGGKTAITATLGVTTQNTGKVDDVEIETTLVNFGTSITRTTGDGRWEYGVGCTVTAMVVDVDSDALDEETKVMLFTPSAQIRINSDLLGSQKNFLVYTGFVAGVTIADYDAFDDEVGVFGPKFGGEYYFTSNVAVQLEDKALFDTEKGFTNDLSLGIKLLF